MNDLVIPLPAIAEHGKEIDVKLAAGTLNDGGSSAPGAEQIQLGEVRIQGQLKSVDSEYLFQGTLAGTYSRPCDRCLALSARPFDIDVMWFFEPGTPEDALEEGDTFEMSHEDEGEPRRTFEGKEIDLTEHVREEILLTAPAKFLCSNECEGLCPQCGANLNDGACACVSDDSTGHPGLAQLADMFPELRPSEE